ncbi:Lysophospholipase [Frankia canadensis]|uniref:Lysophospholipase n=1 Tax=Frankia canadensis TaxID=1836972 RepID=A0A2I2L254_9ACTN|nr:alpha/beta hydrolase [Frankia canadensis]SNQ51947.1 Lysophospholipase [Frankia canadensis]SOU59237.1 Lysophospholipase [Frankia canadensis]
MTSAAPPSSAAHTGEQPTASPAPTLLAWDNPPAIAPRGTVLLVAGRGEHPGVYERFGSRVAFDGYRVRALGDPTRDPDAVTADLRTLLADPDLPAPRVLAGSDAGAAFAAALVATGAVRVDALLLAGLPTAPDGQASSSDGQAPAQGQSPAGGPDDGGWEAELAVRTACPTHQGRLAADPRVRRGDLRRPVPASWLADGDLARVDVPVLGLHGAADTVSPLRQARKRYAAARRAELVVIEEGRHDALNDATHRSAAAEIVLFLERLRLGADLPVIARRLIGPRGEI